MRNFTHLYLCLVFCAVCSAADAAATEFPLSKYGQIQNVQSYSSNPYYNPNSPYNQRMPIPIYAQGAELNAGECQAIMASLVAQQCAMKNNCAGARVSDIRPVIMMQLASLPGHNYAASCGGYLDGAFNDYMKNANTLNPSGFPSAFPAGGGASTQPTSNFAISNPFERSNPEWLDNRLDRQKELRALQRQTGSDDVKLAPTEMPKTFADLSFVERQEILRQGYEPWKDSKAYVPIKIEDDKKRYQREADEAELKAEAEKKKEELMKLEDPCGWCKKYQMECMKDRAEQLEKINKELIKNACNQPNIKEYLLYQIDRNDLCLSIVQDTKKQKITKDMCNQHSGGYPPGGPPDSDPNKTTKKTGYCTDDQNNNALIAHCKAVKCKKDKKDGYRVCNKNDEFGECHTDLNPPIPARVKAMESTCAGENKLYNSSTNPGFTIQ